MGRRSHSTLRDTEASRRAAHQSYLADQEAKTRLTRMLNEGVKKDFRVQAVLARLDAADELDRQGVERRLEAWASTRVDIGEGPL